MVTAAPKAREMEPSQIFIVEDEFIIAEDIGESLKEAGYAVCGMASSGEQALAALAGSKPDLVLMDIFLKGKMDGIETAEKIRSHFDIPVVFLTAYAQNETVQRAKTTGAFAYLIKPFTDRELQAAIEMAIYKHRMEAEQKTLVRDLQDALAKVKVLSGLLPICSQCKKIRDDKGYWNHLEKFIATHSDATFSHGICPECTEALYGNESWYSKFKEKKTES
jgi:CheY-like chemotaxis protein